MINIRDCVKDISQCAEYFLLDKDSHICGVTTPFKQAIATSIMNDSSMVDHINRYVGVSTALLRTWVHLHTNDRLCASMREQLYHAYDRVISRVSRTQFNKEIRLTCIIYQNKYRHSIDQFRMYYEHISNTESIYEEFVQYDNDANNIHQYITECITEFIVENSLEFTARAKYIPIQYMSVKDSINIIQSRINNLSSLHRKLQCDDGKVNTYRVYMFDRIPKDIVKLLNIIMGISAEDHFHIQSIFKDNKPEMLMAHLSKGDITRDIKLWVYKHIVCMDGYFYLVPPHVKHVISQTNWDWEITNIDDSGISLVNLSDIIYDKIGMSESNDISEFVESGLYRYSTFKHSTYLNLDMYMTDMFEDTRIRDNSETVEFKNHYSRLMDLAIRTDPDFSVLDVAQ